MIKKKTIDEIFSVTRVEDVIEDYVNLKRRGVNMIGLCPFHNEKTPSFTVSPTKNLYKCFGCGKGGSAVNFLMEHESFTYPEALRYLANKYNIRIEEEERTDEAIEEQKKRDSLLLINQMAVDFFREQLLETEEGNAVGISYFKHRGLNQNTIDIFELGYSPKDSKSFLKHAIAKGYNESLLKEVGLISSGGYDFYRERVIFPFHNLSGKVIGFGGRILKDNKKAPKYLNSPESDIYNKRKTLYGLFQSRKEIRKKDQCILVEGYTDVLSLYQSEIKNAVASSGTSLTVEQVNLIKRFTPNVIVLYDGDEAGQKAALRGLDIFLKEGLNVKVVNLPVGHDPDSFVTELGSTDFLNFIEENGKDFILKLAHHIHDNFKNDPVNKSIQIKELVKSIALITDQIKRSLYIKQSAQILDIEEATLIGEINRNIKSDIYKRNNQRNNQRNSQYNNDYSNQYGQQEQYQNVEKGPKTDHSQGANKIIDQTDYQEKDIIRILINGGDKFYDEDGSITITSYVMSNLEGMLENFKNETHKRILQLYQEAEKKNTVITKDFWTNHSDEALRSVAIDFLSDKYTYANWSEKGLELQTQKPVEENYAKDSYQAVLRYKFKKVEEQLEEIKTLKGTIEDELLLTVQMKLIVEKQNIAKQLNTI